MNDKAPRIYHSLLDDDFVCSKHGRLNISSFIEKLKPEHIQCAQCYNEKKAEENRIVTGLKEGVEIARTEKWDRRFLRLAAHWASECSKDPSTKVGSVLVSPDRRQVVLGYNGFPPGVEDSEERYADRAEKYARVVHAEANAISNAPRDIKGWSIYVHPLLPCSGHDGGHNCAGNIISKEIARVVVPYSAKDNPRWGKSNDIALEMFKESGVEIIFLTGF